MSLPLPTASDGYIVLAGHKISVELWNHVIAEIAARIAALEAVKSDLEDAVAAVTTDAMELVANSVAPSLADVQAQIADMNALLALAEDRLAAISSGGVVADNVTVQPIDGLEATNAQDALEVIMAAIGVIVGTTIPALNDAKLAKASKANEAALDAGTSETTYVTPLGLAYRQNKVKHQIGDILESSSAAPVQDGTWLRCDGKAYLQSAYPDLFAKIKHRYRMFIPTSETSPNFGSGVAPISMIGVGSALIIGVRNSSTYQIRKFDGATLATVFVGGDMVGGCSGFVQGNGRIVGYSIAINLNGYTCSIDNGVSFTRPGTAVNDIFYSVAYGLGKFVGMRHHSTAANRGIFSTATPETLASWVRETSGIQLNVVTGGDVTFGNGRFVGVADTRSFVSVDGDTWAIYALPRNIGANPKILFLEGVFYAIGSETYVSTDGETWQRLPVNFLANSAPSVIDDTQIAGTTFSSGVLISHGGVESLIDLGGITPSTASPFALLNGALWGANNVTSNPSLIKFAPAYDAATQFAVPYRFGHFIRAV